MGAQDDTAKWSVGERIDLAAGLARIEEILVNQDARLDELLEVAKHNTKRLNRVELNIEEKSNRLELKITAASSRIAMHEKVVAGTLTVGGIFGSVWKWLS